MCKNFVFLSDEDGTIWLLSRHRYQFSQYLDLEYFLCCECLVDILAVLQALFVAIFARNDVGYSIQVVLL